MIVTARPARFGRGEQTLMDLSVRDTWEITVAYQASADDVSVAAFYADCRHEVKPVRTGYRVTTGGHCSPSAPDSGGEPLLTWLALGYHDIY